jgi:hypothetical protein
MKWGTLYGPEYVNILYHMVKRHLSQPFRFICITDSGVGLESGIDIVDLPPFNEPPPEYYILCQAWRKLLLFENPLYGIEGKVLFLDLDVVIVDSIDCFFEFSDNLCIIENWSQPNRLIGQASVMSFTAGQHPELLEKYRKQQDLVVKKHITEQVYIPRELGKGHFDFFPEEWCKSFKYHCMHGGIKNSFLPPAAFPKNSKIIVFHGHPNPINAIEGNWGKPVPWYKRFYKTVKPTQWVAEHWR